MKKNYKAFTLVELIVVITILAILSTVGFVAYTDYLRGVRDSSRITQMTEIYKSLTLYSARSRLPMPEESISIVAGLNKVGTQGYANQSILDSIKYSDGGVDPKTKSFYTYFVSADRKYAQILGFFEERRVGELLTVATSLFAFDTGDYASLYPQVKGAELGILLEDNTQIPVQELDGNTLDIITTTGNLKSYLNNADIITGTGEALFGMVPNTDCKKLFNSIPGLQSGKYKVNPSGIKSVDVYCEMDDDNKGYGEGWTLVARTHPTGGTGFSWLSKLGSVYDDSAIYSMGSDVQNFRFSEIMIATYDTTKNITAAMTAEVNSVFFQSGIQSPETSISLQEEVTSNCQLIYNGARYTNDGPGDNCGGIKNWGAFGDTTRYVFGKKLTDAGGLLYSDGIHTNSDGMRKDKDTGGSVSIDNLRGEQGMLFVR